MNPFTVTLPGVPKREGDNFDRSVKQRLEKLLPVRVPSYTVQELNTLNVQEYSGYLVYCSNGNSGVGCMTFCDGQSWKLIELGAAVSL